MEFSRGYCCFQTNKKSQQLFNLSICNYLRCIEHILKSTRGTADLSVSYLQIYCEMVGDLLNPTGTPLSIRERAGGSVYVEGISCASVASVEDLKIILETGERNRSTASTLMNTTSSRSHAALIINITFPPKCSSVSITSSSNDHSIENPQRRESSLVLVDLAGSERASASNGIKIFVIIFHQHCIYI